MNLAAAVSIVAPIVAVVGILVVVRRATGGISAARIAGTGEAHQAVLDADIAFVPADTLIGVDGLSALVSSTQAKGLAVAYVVGNRVAGRTLSPIDVRSAQWFEGPDEDMTLRLCLRDFGCPEIRVRLGRAEVERWQPRVDAVAHAKT